MGKTLLVYYSLSAGNTKKIAEQVQHALGCDAARLDTVTPYTGSYEEIVEQGHQEVKRAYQPELKPLEVNVADYDRVIVGTPTWWYTMAPAVLTFLSSQDWNGKTVIPFQTHGGWPGRTLKDIKAVCRGARFVHEKDIQFDSTGGSEMITPAWEIDEWIQSL
jgi:flavodoxin